MRISGSALLLASILVSPTAFAADLARPAPAPMPVKAVPYVPIYDWTGFYLGANIGYGWTSGSGTVTFAGVPGPYSGSGDGVLGGIQAGYNWQVNSFVLGLEADIQASGGRGDVNGTAGAAVINGTGKVPYFGTIRGRIGYAFDRWMLYATGGALYGKGTLDGTVSTTGPFSASATYWTYVVGGGAEFALWDRWTAKLEYLYAGSPSDVPVPPGTNSVSGNGHSHVVRAGVNYRF